MTGKLSPIAEGQTYDPVSGTVSGNVISGNPVSYYNGRRWDFSWEKGTRLSTAASGDTAVSYAHDTNGIRKSKTVNGTTYHYVTQNGRVVRQTWNDNILDFDINSHDGDGNTALIVAAQNNEIEIAELLIEKGADKNLTDREGKTALDYALENDNKEMARICGSLSGEPDERSTD